MQRDRRRRCDRPSDVRCGGVRRDRPSVSRRAPERAVAPSEPASEAPGHGSDSHVPPDQRQRVFGTRRRRDGCRFIPMIFARQMAWLKRRRYRTVTQRELFAALFRARPLGPRADPDHVRRRLSRHLFQGVTGAQPPRLPRNCVCHLVSDLGRRPELPHVADAARRWSGAGSRSDVAHECSTAT